MMIKTTKLQRAGRASSKVSLRSLPSRQESEINEFLLLIKQTKQQSNSLSLAMKRGECKFRFYLHSKFKLPYHVRFIVEIIQL